MKGTYFKDDGVLKRFTRPIADMRARLETFTSTILGELSMVFHSRSCYSVIVTLMMHVLTGA